MRAIKPESLFPGMLIPSIKTLFGFVFAYGFILDIQYVCHQEHAGAASSGNYLEPRALDDAGLGGKGKAYVPLCKIYMVVK